MIHEIVEAIHKEQTIRTGSFTKRTVFSKIGTKPWKTEVHFLTLDFSYPLLEGTVKPPLKLELMQNVAEHLKARGWTVPPGTITLYPRKKKKGYNVTLNPEKHNITISWGGQLPLLERMKLKRTLKKLVAG